MHLTRPKAKVYYVSCPDDPFALIAIRPKIREGEIKWFDTFKDRRFRISQILESTHERLVFERETQTGKFVYTLVPLTLEIYNEKVKSKLMEPRDFDNKEEMNNAFLNL